MTSETSIQDFREKYENGKAQVVGRTIVSDLETPVSAYIKLAGDRENAFLLESVEGGDQLGRYSIIGIKPDLIWRATAGRSEINRSAGKAGSGFALENGAPLGNLRRLINESRIDLDDTVPPMAAGLFGYLGYDMVRQMERLGPRPGGGLATPDSVFVRPTIVAVFDNVRREIRLFTPVRPTSTVSARDAWDAAQARLAQTVEDLQAPLFAELISAPDTPLAPIEFHSNTGLQKYSAMVENAREFIRAGDIFQVVLSQRFSADFPYPPFSLYRALRRSNPSPFLFFQNFGAFALVGSSPEILVRLRGDEITIRPIAGTRPRGETPADDAANAADLLADEKERAEHLMLLDLGRNDVGRVAKVGSVNVTESFAIERYSHVMHIVSNVVGKTRGDVDPIDIVAAGFPAGTVSGAPKIRAMQIIDELEQSGRGVYGGAVGYFSAGGDVDTCIALRTAVVTDNTMYVQAGAGIVADSQPAAEQAECENKAKALFSAAANIAELSRKSGEPVDRD